MTENEELIRRAMRAHAHEAPSVADLRGHDLLPAPWQLHAPRRAVRWLAVAAAAVCVLALVGVLVTMNRGAGGHQVAGARPSADSTRSTSSPPLTCPKSYKISWSGWVPQQPKGVDGKDRLVPTEEPRRTVVCAYSDGVTLTKSVALYGDLSIVPSTLGWIPRTLTHSWPCTSDLRTTDTANFLFGISYPDGTLWASAPGNHCSGASNGKFAVMANLSTYARDAISTGSWTVPGPDTVNGCPGSIDTPDPAGWVRSARSCHPARSRSRRVSFAAPQRRSPLSAR